MVRTSQARLAQRWWYLTGRIPRAKPDIQRGENSRRVSELKSLFDPQNNT